MPSDIRIDISFPHHRKRKRLLHFLGHQGVVSLIDLWCKVAEQFPSGHLENYTVDDIEIDAGWDGEPGQFVKVLLDKKVCFLEEKKDGFHIHNWKKRQPWVSNSENRSEISRFNILKKKNPKIRQKLQKLGVESITREQYDCLVNTKVTLKQRLINFKQCLSDCLKNSSEFKPNAHSPSPSPVPLHKRTPKADNKKFKPSSKKNPNPETSSGKFKPKKTDVKNKDFTINLTNTFLQINELCDKIMKLPKTTKRKKNFNPRQWSQKQINNIKHPGAIAKTLDGLIMYWDTSRDPWSYSDDMLSKLNGTFNEADAIAINDELKKQSHSGDIEKLTNGLFKQLL